jgi:hypothetical protein
MQTLSAIRPHSIENAITFEFVTGKSLWIAPVTRDVMSGKHAKSLDFMRFSCIMFPYNYISSG